MRLPAARAASPATAACFSVALLPFLLIAGSLTECGWIVDAGDYAVGAPAADAAQDGAAAPSDGTLGAEGDVDAITDAPVADAPADVANAMEVEASGNASPSSSTECESGGPAPICGQGLPTGTSAFQDIVRACVLAISCDPNFFQTNLSNCITNDWLAAYASYACLTTIQDCDGYFQCQGLRGMTPADCPDTLAAARCDSAGNVAIDCNFGVVTSCDLYGGSCSTYSVQGIAHAGCNVAPSCSDTDGLLHCAGNAAYTCYGGTGIGRDCSLEGATCNGGAGSAGCYFEGPACATAGSYTCRDDELVFCDSALREFTYDCAAVGLSCVADGGTGNCLAPGFEASPCPADSCGPDGKTITTCVGGASLAVDCSTIAPPSFTGCFSRHDSTNGLTYALCE